MLDPLPLTTAEICTLEACSLHARHPRQRRRAQAVLGHHRGQSLGQLAAFYAVRYATVHAWIQAWRQLGLAGLAEGRRTGRPLKLPPSAQKK
jgi:transposase